MDSQEPVPSDSSGSPLVYRNSAIPVLSDAEKTTLTETDKAH